MNLLKSKWINRGNLKVIYEKNKMIIENDSNQHKFLIYPKLFKSNQNKKINISLNGKLLNGDGCTLKILNRRKTILSECGLNSTVFTEFEFLKYFIIILYVPSSSKMEISSIEFVQNDPQNLFESFLKNDTLVITPGYPSLENKYNTAFVHTRVLEYKKANINADVLVINSLPGKKVYTYEGVTVVKADFYFLRNLLSQKKYKRLLVHFFDDTFGNVFDSVDLSRNKFIFLFTWGRYFI